MMNITPPRASLFAVLHATLPIATVATLICSVLWLLFHGVDGGQLSRPLVTALGSIFLCVTSWSISLTATGRMPADVRLSGIMGRLRIRPGISIALLIFALLMGWPGHVAFFGSQATLFHGWILSLILSWSYWIPLALLAINFRPPTV